MSAGAWPAPRSINGADKRAPPGIGSIPNKPGPRARNERMPIRRFATRRSISPEASITPPINGMIPTTNDSSRTDGSDIVSQSAAPKDPNEWVKTDSTIVAIPIPRARSRRETTRSNTMANEKPIHSNIRLPSALVRHVHRSSRTCLVFKIGAKGILSWHPLPAGLYCANSSR